MLLSSQFAVLGAFLLTLSNGKLRIYVQHDVSTFVGHYIIADVNRKYVQTANNLV